MTGTLAAALALSLSLDTAWGDRTQAGSETLRGDVERQIASALVGEGCFARVLPAGAPGGDVRLEVILEGLREEKSFDDSLAQYAEEGREPSQDLRVQATVEVFVRWRLWIPGRPAPFREKRFRVLRELRPRFPGDDPATWAREQALETIARETSRGVCKAAGPKLEAAARRP